MDNTAESARKPDNGEIVLLKSDLSALSAIKRSGFLLVTNPDHDHRKAIQFSEKAVTLTGFRRLRAAGAIVPIDGETLIDGAEPQRWRAAR